MSSMDGMGSMSSMNGMGNMSSMSGMGDMSSMGGMESMPAMGSMGNMGAMPSPTREWTERLEPIFKQASGDFRSLVAYVLGGFVVRALTMWYSRRKNYAALCGMTRNLIMHCAAALPDAAFLNELRARQKVTLTINELNAARHNLARWIIMAHELAMLKARGQMDADAAYQHLSANKLCKAGEWERMVGGDRHTTVIFWIQTLMNRINQLGGISNHNLSTVARATTGLRAQANDLQSALDRDLPYPYSSLVGMLVKINLFLMSTWKGLEIALDVCGAGPPSGKWSDAWSTGRMGRPPQCEYTAHVLASDIAVRLIVLLFWNVSYAAMFDLCKILHNPFGNRRIDVAHEVIQNGLKKLADELLCRGDEVLPPDMLRAPSGAPGDISSIASSLDDPEPDLPC